MKLAIAASITIVVVLGWSLLTHDSGATTLSDYTADDSPNPLADPAKALVPRQQISSESDEIQRVLMPGDPDVEERFLGLLKNLKVLGVNQGDRELTEIEEASVLAQAKIAVDALEQRRNDLHKVNAKYQGKTQALLLEQEAQSYEQLAAIANRRFIRGSNAFKAVHDHGFTAIYDQWRAIGCNLPNGEDIVFMVPIWEGSPLRAACDEAKRLRRQ